MDALSDILSSFFVNPNNKKKYKLNNNKQIQSEIATQTDFLETENETENQVEKQVENVTENQTEKQVEKQSEKQTEKQTAKKSSESSKLQSELSNELSSELSSELPSESSSESSSEYLKKYILKPSEFYKKNIMIINKDFNDSVIILSDILYKLSLMKNVDEIFNNNIYITSTNENKPIYKQMLLDNPYLYFTNFNVKNKLDKGKIKELDNRRTICILDNELLSSIGNDDFQSLLDKNVLLITMTNDDDKNTVAMYDLLGSNKILIHKINKLKMIQKRFYKNFIKYICKEQVSNFDKYYDIINDENLDIKYLVLKNNELRYN